MNNLVGENGKAVVSVWDFIQHNSILYYLMIKFLVLKTLTTGIVYNKGLVRGATRFKSSKVSKYLFEASHRLHVERAKLAATEVHEHFGPFATHVALVGRLPIVAEPNIRKRITFFPWACTRCVGNVVFIINHHLPLILSRQTPHSSL